MCNTVEQAVSLAKKNKTAKFTESLDAVFMIRKGSKDKTTFKSYVELPHGIGKELKIGIFADEGEVDPKYRVTVTDASVMKREMKKYDRCGATTTGSKTAVKYARILGPLGMMPTSKAGNVLPDSAALVQFLGRSVLLTERINANKIDADVKCKAGSSDMNDTELVSNLRHLYSCIQAALTDEKTKIHKCYISTTMGAGYEVTLKSLAS